MGPGGGGGGHLHKAMVLLFASDVDIPRYPVPRLGMDGWIEMEDLLAPVGGALRVRRSAQQDFKAGWVLRRPLELDIKEAYERFDGGRLHDLQLKVLLREHYGSAWVSSEA